MLNHFKQKLIDALIHQLKEENAEIKERLIHIEDKENAMAEHIARMEEKQNELIERTIHIEDKVSRLISANQLKIGSNVSSSFMLNEFFYSKHYDFGLFGMWFTQNYGGTLTSYALAKKIKDFGYSVIQIDMSDIGSEKSAWNMENPDRQFIEKHFEKTATLRPWQAGTLNKICSAFVIGSDSLWGGGYDYQLSRLRGTLFGEFTQKPIISFSTSWGTFEPVSYANVENTYISSLLSRFTHISTREQSGVKICADFFKVKASWTLDPVFLVSKDEWQSIAAAKTELNPYILNMSNRNFLCQLFLSQT